LKPNHKTNKEAEALLDRYKAGICSPEDIALMESWYLNYQSDAPKLSDAEIDSRLVEVRNHLLTTNPGINDSSRSKIIALRTQIAIAASILIAVVSVYFIFYAKDSTEELRLAALDAGIKPGENKAILTLANGVKVVLNNTKAGELVKQSGISVRKSSNGTIVFQVTKGLDAEQNAEASWNTLETPKGGQYQIILSDGSEVWLNAFSTLRFPTVFSPKQREVEVTGEAYFRISKHTIGQSSTPQPFVVNTNKQKIKVLGTQFNVNSYQDEQTVTTTLLEGSIAVSPFQKDLSKKVETVLLKPGQQSELGNSGTFEVNTVDVREAIDWQKGYFAFHNEDVYQIMRKVARWYDIQVIYESSLPKDKLGGTLSRYQDVSKIFDVMQRTGLFKFKIKGKTVYVAKA
jgi:transmembrane sensor